MFGSVMVTFRGNKAAIADSRSLSFKLGMSPLFALMSPRFAPQLWMPQEQCCRYTTKQASMFSRHLVYPKNRLSRVTYEPHLNTPSTQ